MISYINTSSTIKHINVNSTLQVGDVHIRFANVSVGRKIYPTTPCHPLELPVKYADYWIRLPKYRAHCVKSQNVGM